MSTLIVIGLILLGIALLIIGACAGALYVLAKYNPFDRL